MSNLADTASKDSIQALAKWIGFRRKHIKSFSKSMASATENPSSSSNNNNNTANGNFSTRQWLYLRILHEAIILDSGTSRWERLAEMREILGDALLEVAKSGCLDWQTTKKVEGFVKQWDTLNAFGGPTLINVIKKQLAAPKTIAETTADGTDDKTASPDTSTTKTTASQVSPASPQRSQSPTRSPKRDTEGAPKSPPIEADPAAGVDAMAMEATSPPKESVNTKTEPTTPVTPKVPRKEVTYDFEAKVRFLLLLDPLFTSVFSVKYLFYYSSLLLVYLSNNRVFPMVRLIPKPL